MNSQRKLAIGCFLLGCAVAVFLVGVVEIRDISALLQGDRTGIMILAILGTVQFGVAMPITCILWKYHAERFNFFNAFMISCGFTVGTGLSVGYFGSYLFASLYVLISTGILSGFYIVTCELHRRIETQPAKNRHE